MSCTVVAPRARDPLRVDGSSTLTRRRVDVLIIGWRHLSDEGGDGTGGAYDLPDPTVDEEASVADRKNAVRVTMRTSDQVRAVDEFATSERAKTDATFDRLDDRVLDPLDSLDLETSGLEIEVTADHVAAILQERAVAATKVYATLDLIGKDLTHFFPKVPEVLPAKIYGRLLNPNGTAAEGVSVRALEPVDDSTTPWPNPAALTDRRGSFALTLPPRPISENGMRLLVTGSNRIVELGIRRADLVAGNGDLGVLPLDQAVEPLPRSAVAQLGDVVVPTSDTDVLENPSEYAVPAPVVTLGDGDCAMSFRSNLGVIDKYRYSLLVRLVAPQLSNRRLGTRVRQEGRKGTTLSASTTGFGKYVGVEDLIGAMTQLGNWEIIERVPIDAPIDVDAFLDLVERDPKRVPKAASLGLGYVVKMHQIWIPTGLSLGDLVYSLPLAPGEQQRIAISDEREILSVREQEAMTAQEYQRYNEAADSSTNAVFRSAFDEAASGGSRMKVNTESGSFGGGLGVGAIFGPIVAGLGIGGGYSDSTTTGSTSSWQNASRDYVSNASQDFHSSLSRQASARREASRTSVRLASASEQRQVVTKVITNHNHNHALTMQYWQVLRHFGVSSVVDDVQLVCFVPLEVVRFLPSSQPRSLPTGTYNRNVLLARYSALLRYHDVIMGRVWRRPEMRHGLRVLQAFAGNPTMTVESSTGSAQDIVDVKITGTFLPCEDIYVTAFSTSGSRIGPVRMSSTSASVAGGLETRAALIQALRTRRTSTFETRSAGLTLPEHIARSDVARLEFSRTFTTFSYRLSLPSSLSFTDILSYLSNTSALDVTLTAADLEREVGGPLVNDPTAKINGTIELLESYNGPGGSETMTAVFPVAARRLAPELSFADLLRIEGVLQHVVQNTVEFSKAVWQSLTPEERAIMLESYTIGVPSGGAPDATDDVPLLNCVANTVVGYFGNAAIMPFFIPPDVAGKLGKTSREVQEALLRFHRQAYAPAQSSITLPARGVLGEAVLGHCESSEKIDLTRFWNWQDSPPDEATDPATLSTLFAGGNQLVGPGGAGAPAALQTGPMVTINQGPAALSPADLASQLIASMPETNLPKDMTGITQLGAQMKVQTETTAETLNKTIAEATGLAKKAMDVLPSTVGAKKANAPNGTTGGGSGGSGGGGTGGSGAGSSGTGSGGTGTGGGTTPSSAPLDGGAAPTP